jgi:hypothetical protein
MKRTGIGNIATTNKFPKLIIQKNAMAMPLELVIGLTRQGRFWIWEIQM